MAEINKNMQTPGIDQLSKQSREIFYKEHEFQPTIATVIDELNILLSDDGSSSIINKKRQEAAALLVSQVNEVDNVSAVALYKIELLFEQLTELDSAYERIYNKLLNDIYAININLHNKTQLYDIPSSYYTNMKNGIIDTYGQKSPYKTGKTFTIDESNRWSIRAPASIIMLRDVDPGCQFVTHPVIIDPEVSKTQTIKLLEFNPLLNGIHPVFLAQLLISGDLYAFKGYLKSQTIDKYGKRGALFEADYAVSYEIPFTFKVVYDDETNKVILLYKTFDTIFYSLVKFDFSVNLLIGSNLVFEKNNTVFTEELDT
jgi:hypothetical protein